ncbi:MAG: ATP-dependent protease, partial [Limisphaerales bacterium]
ESNVKNLMLRQSVVDAVRQGKFHIYPIQNVHQGIECLTGLRAGQRGTNGRFPKKTLNGLVEQRLIDFAEKSRSFHANDGKEDKK